MKDFKDITWKCTEEEYRADPAYSYSVLSRFDREGFEGLDTLYDPIDTPSLRFGSIVDTLLTGSMEEFKQRYEVAELPEISDSLVEIVTALFNSQQFVFRSLELIPDEIISATCKAYGYYANDKYEGFRVRKVREECTQYYNLLYLSIGKQLVSQKDYNEALECARMLKTSNATKWYFKENNPFDNIRRYYQLKIKDDWQGIPVRGMMDLIIVDYDKKIIIPCDLKTSGKNEWEFPKSFIQFRYFIQSQLYWYLLRRAMDKDEYFKDFTLMEFRFIVINRHNMKPLVWEYKDSSKSNGISFEGTDYRNWRQILTDLDYYHKNPSVFPKGILCEGRNDIVEWLNNLKS